MVEAGRFGFRSADRNRPPPGPCTPAPAPAPAAVQRSAWQDLPPMRPVMTATPPIAPLDAFTSSLATRAQSQLPRTARVTSSIPTGRAGTSTGWPTRAAADDLDRPRADHGAAAETVADHLGRAAADRTTGALRGPEPRPAAGPGGAAVGRVRRFDGAGRTDQRGGSRPRARRLAGGRTGKFRSRAGHLVPADGLTDAPPVRTAPLLSAPQQPPVTSLPAVAGPIPAAPVVARSAASTVAPVPSSAGPVGAGASSAPAVQRVPDGGEPAHGAGPVVAASGWPTAPLAGRTSMPTVSRIADFESTTDGEAGSESGAPSGFGSAETPGPGAGTGPAAATGPASARVPNTGSATASPPAAVSGAGSALTLPPAAGSLGRPAVQRSSTDATADPEPAPSRPEPERSFTPDSTPDVAPAAAAPLAVAPTLSASVRPTLSAPTGSAGPSGASAVQRHAESPSPSPAAGPSATAPRSAGLGAPLTGVPSRPRETVVHEPQPMDFATIMRIIDSAAATGSTEISLPSAPSAPTPSGTPARPVAPTLGGSGRPGTPRPSGLGAPLTSGVAPTGVQRSVPSPMSTVAGTVESAPSIQRALDSPGGSGPVVPRRSDVGADPTRTGPARDRDGR